MFHEYAAPSLPAAWFACSFAKTLESSPSSSDANKREYHWTRRANSPYLHLQQNTHNNTHTHLFAKLSVWRRRLTNEEVDVVVRQLEHSRVKVLLDWTSDQGSRGPEDHVDVRVRNQPFDSRIVQQFALLDLVELTQNLRSSLKTFHKKQARLNQAIPQ